MQSWEHRETKTELVLRKKDYTTIIIFSTNKKNTQEVFYVRCILGSLGFEPRTTSLKGCCSTDWAMSPQEYFCICFDSRVISAEAGLLYRLRACPQINFRISTFVLKHLTIFLVLICSNFDRHRHTVDDYFFLDKINLERSLGRSHTVWSVISWNGFLARKHTNSCHGTAIQNNKIARRIILYLLPSLLQPFQLLRLLQLLSSLLQLPL